MGKRFASKTCAYCSRALTSSTADHVFARKFFPTDARGNLPKVPACQSCNNRKSELEHYLTTVLPMGSWLPGAADTLEADVAPRLLKNQKLRRDLQSGMSNVLVVQNGQFLQTFAMPFDSEKLCRYFELVVRGLYALNVGTPLPAAAYVWAGFPYDHAIANLTNALHRVEGQKVSVELPRQVFTYRANISEDNDGASIWRFTLFGGLRLSGDDSTPDAVFDTIWAVTADRHRMTEAQTRLSAA